MNLKTKLAAAALLLGSVSMAQATTYDVMGEIFEPNAAVFNTTFTGTFDWNGTSLSNLMGTMNSSMDSPIEDLTLNQNLQWSQTGTVVTASIFKENTSDVFSGGGYATGGAFKYGNAAVSMMGTLIAPADGNVANENAYFSFSFDTLGMVADVSSIVYGDCTPDGLMMGGQMCMTGHNIGTGGTMDAMPLALNISEVSAVPVPAAAWLFGGALMSLFGANRRKNILPA